MNFKEELVKELGLGAIAEKTMLDDYVKACKAIAVRYHKSEVEKLHIPVVGNMLFFTLDEDDDLCSLHTTEKGAIAMRKEMLKDNHVKKCTVNEMVLEE